VAANDNFVVETNSRNNELRVLANDSDLDLQNDFLKVIAITPSSKGMALIDATDQYVIYTPNTGATGTDHISYVVTDGFLVSFGTITITIGGGNTAAPSAGADFYTVKKDSLVNRFEVLVNDSDLEGRPLFIAAATQGAHGTVVIAVGSTAILYTPHPGFQGTDSFTYTVSDGLLSTTATVTVSVQGAYRILLPSLAR
jgi:hypothetical protein